jgi:hypothetical protein
MSRQNKVNPGTYTQRGRLTQDDAARELQKQNALGSPQTWQPVKKNAMPTTKAARAKPSKTVTSNTATGAVGRTKAAKAAKPAVKGAVTKTARNTVMARNVGGAGPKARRTAKHRTS